MNRTCRSYGWTTASYSEVVVFYTDILILITSGWRDRIRNMKLLFVIRKLIRLCFYWGGFATVMEWNCTCFLRGFTIGFSNYQGITLRIQVLWVMRLWWWMIGSQCIEVLYSLYLQRPSSPRRMTLQDEGNMILCSVRNHSLKDTLSHPRSPKSSTIFCKSWWGISVFLPT